MKTVTVHASKEYDVLIGQDLIGQLGSISRKMLKTRRVTIISDSNVWPLYGNIAKESLSAFGFDVLHYVFPAGEASKSADVYISILNFLAQHHMTRSDLLIALGGGVVGDMTGFVAATYLRGIPYIQVPTSLLAMVDSSVGGKTAIDLAAGKNLAGAFYQPSLVLCDTTALATLPDAILRDGCAEVIKYGILYDAQLFTHLSSKGLDFDREYVIARCVALKAQVVTEDEFDTGARQKLNLGHTIGHAIEAKSNFTISHGQAVAIGMAVIAKIGHAEDICDKSVLHMIISILKAFNLPSETHFSVDEILDAVLSDKKRFGDCCNFIVPAEIGNCVILTKPITQLYSFIEAGLS